MMKVLYFHQYFSTPEGSTGTRSYEFSKELINAGHSVTVVCGSGSFGKSGLKNNFVNGMRTGEVEGINIIEIESFYSNYLSLPKRALIFMKFAMKSIQIAWSEKYDVLYATSTPLTIAIPGIVMRILKPNKKFLFEVRDLWPELPRAMKVVTNPFVLFGLSVLEKLAYLSMNKGIALAPGIRRGMQKSIFPKKEVFLIPNGCDLATFKPGLDDQKSAKHLLTKLQIGINPDDFVAVFTGAHGVANGLDAVLDAAGLLRDYKNIKILFVGEGKMKPHLVKRVESEKLDNCIFIDPVPKLELAKIMQEVDVGLMVLANIPAFYYGTSPNKFFDYISAGLPVVNNYNGWIKEMIIKDSCGLVVEPGDALAFANAIVELSKNKELVSKMGSNARILAEREFGREELAKKLVKVIETFKN